jgi:hypothetical protein
MTNLERCKANVGNAKEGLEWARCEYLEAMDDLERAEDEYRIARDAETK